MGSCAKCGATYKKRPVKYVQGVAASVLEQSAVVQFRSKVSTGTMGGKVTTFFPSQMVKLDFSILHTLLSDNCAVLTFLKRTERIEFELTYPNLGC